MFKQKWLPPIYADTFGVPRQYSIPIFKKFELWCKASGPEWAVARMKSIKQDFIRVKSGENAITPWFKKESPLILGGPFKGLQKWATTYKRWKSALQIFQVYTQHFSPDVTPLQEQKFLKGVTAPNIPVPDYVVHGCVRGVKRLGLFRPYLPLPKPLLSRMFSPNKKEPHANGKTYSEGICSLECALSFTRGTHLGWDFRSRFPEIFNVVEDSLVYDDRRDGDVTSFPNSVGTIGFIQEPGYKLRAVANPARVYQQALKPLGDSLFEILKTLPWDCTFNQLKGMNVVRSHLAKRQKTFSVDLTNATDVFPLDLQIQVLNQIYGFRSSYKTLFYMLSKSPWFYRSNEDTICWSKGQPLGLYPSFASFALTHGLLLFSLNGFCHDDKFFVLGDDVIILDQVLYEAYITALNDMECPISLNKTLVSNSIGEFAGKVITRYGFFPLFKWRIPSDDSFLDIVRNFGPKVISLLRPRQRRICELLFTVPDFMGGLGFNPDCLPLEKRMPDFLFKEDVKQYLMSYNVILNRHNYYDRSRFPSYLTVYHETASLDQRVIEIVSKYLPMFLHWYSILGTNLHSIAPDLHLDIENVSSRITTLEHWERVL